MDKQPLRENFWAVPYWAQILLYLVVALAPVARRPAMVSIT
jgi:hypothetical protein